MNRAIGHPIEPLVPTTQANCALVHTEATPSVVSVPADFHKIEALGVPGRQHNPSVCVLDGRLLTSVCVWDSKALKKSYIGQVKDWQLERAEYLAHNSTGGIEDLRMFTWRGRMWAVGAVYRGGPNTRYAWIRQALFELSSSGNKAVRIHGWPSDRNEKNWMPCVDGDRLRLVYSTSPLIVLNVEDKGNAYRIAESQIETMGHAMGYVRGGSQLVPWRDGWLAIVHEVYSPPSAKANPMLGFWGPPPDPISGAEHIVYLHRFAFFDQALSTVKLGKLWYFKHVGIEFACGLVRWQDRFVASFGLADKEAWLAEIQDDTVTNMLEDS